MRKIIQWFGVKPNQARRRKPGRASIRATRPDTGSARTFVLVVVVLAALIAGLMLPPGTGAILAVGLVAGGILALCGVEALDRAINGEARQQQGRTVTQ